MIVDIFDESDQLLASYPIVRQAQNYQLTSDDYVKLAKRSLCEDYPHLSSKVEKLRFEVRPG